MRKAREATKSRLDLKSKSIPNSMQPIFVKFYK